MIDRNTTYAVALAPRRDSLHWTQEEITWGELLSWLDTPADTKACGNYVLGTLTPTTVRHRADADPCTDLHRNKLAVVSRGVLTLDVDHPTADFLDRVRALPYAVVVHTTFSSTPTEPRYRMWVPVDRELAPDEYHVAASAVMQTLGEENFDPGSVQPERYMFRPSLPEDGSAFFWEEVGGPPAGSDALLAEFQEDLSTLPPPRVGKNKRDPFAIEGTVGAFNRAYERLEDLIAEYDLPYEAAGADRWQLAGASAAAGMGYVKPGLVFSHHANDPAYGQACSAFDLVRLHLFSELDEDAPAGTPVNRLPSTEAMRDVATMDLRVVKELVGADFAADMDATANSISQNDWRLGFRLNSRTGKPNDDIQNWDLILENDPAFQGLYYNELSLAIETESDLPWRVVEQGRESFSAGDRSSLALYIEREYSLRPARGYLDDLINDRALNRRVNPVKDYLEGLEWDGVPRLETSLPGVRPTPYTRLVARKSLVAAVARVFEPGCKWDHMMVLYGLEGLGKSHWVEKMSRGFSVSLGRITDKDTLISMQRAWILTSDEGHTLRKADFDVQKEFLTRTADVFRMPYDREAQIHKRHFVIWGTTNDEVFLRRQEGNRRFLIVFCQDKVDFDLLTEEYVDQVWAEAVTLYRAGEQLWLSEEESNTAALQREPFTEEDALTGIIEEYLDTKVPAGWDNMSPMDRQLWLMNSTDELAAQETHSIDRVCSVQVWTEALGRRYGDHKRLDLLEINAALKQIPGWSQLPGRHRIPGYGPQVIFQRSSTIEGFDLL